MKYHRFLPFLLIAAMLLTVVPVSATPDWTVPESSVESPVESETPAATEAPTAEPTTETPETTEEPTPETEEPPATTEPETAETPTVPTESAPEGESPTETPTAEGPEEEPAPQEDSAFSVDGTAALLYEMKSGTILYAQAEREKVYPASLTKVMTCLLALENGSLSDVVTVSEEAINAVEVDARTDTVLAGEEIPLEDLLYYTMLSSSNEACNVIAEYVSGSVEEFVALMNARAEEIGCTGTHFANTNGLHDDNHYTTAYDLMLITKEALKNRTFETICMTTEYEIAATNLQESRTIHTTNYLTSTAMSHRYYYAPAKGIKTGYTGRAGRCLISTAENDDLYLLSVVTGCPTTPGDNGEYILGNFTETVKLFEYGFNSFEFATVLSSSVPIDEIPVENGSQSSVVIAPVSDTFAILPSGYDPEKITTEITLYGGNSIQAPVAIGDVVGVVSIYYDGKLLSESDITPITDVTSGNAVYQTEEELATEQKTVSKNKLTIWECLIFVVIVFGGGYTIYYVRQNMNRRKRRRKRRTSTQHTHNTHKKTIRK